MVNKVATLVLISGTLLFFLPQNLSPSFASESLVSHPKILSQQALSIDIIWILLASFLIFLMQAGFTLVELGFSRAKNSGNIIMKNLTDFTIGSLTFFLVGYGIMYGSSFLGLFGTRDFFLSHVSSGDKIDNWRFANMIFQVVFAANAATIVSGAMAERTKFIGYMFYSFIISGLIYPIVGHWIWGGGWLAELGMIDFAGATVVHSLGGWVSLAGVLVIGARVGRFSTEGKPMPIPGHNMPLVALGVFILWFGWYGFNTGSTLSGANLSIAIIAVNTTISGACGSISAMILSWKLYDKPRVDLTLNGALAGLVSSTATSPLVNPYSAMAIGAMAGFILPYSLRIFEKFKVDDPVGAISVHGISGIWGTLAVGLFTQSTFSHNSLNYEINGLLFGGGLNLLRSQTIGVLAVFLWAFPVAYVFFKLINATVGLRVSYEEEVRGLDYGEHAMSSYPLFDEFQSRQEWITEELKKVKEFSTFYEISQSMHTLNLDAILKLILEGVTRTIGFDRARLYLINAEKNLLECRMAVGIDIDKERIKEISLPIAKENSVIARVVLEREPLVITDAANDPRVNRDLMKILKFKSFAAVPLIGKDRVIGAITADNLLSDRVINGENLRLLEIFANQAGLAIENAEMYEELKGFNEQLEKRIKLATEDLRQTQQSLIQSGKLAALGQLSAGIAHEIRNPLTSIKVLINSMIDRISLDETAKGDFEVIEREIERMNDIIKRFLDFARPAQPHLEIYSIQAIIEDTILLLTPQMKEQRVDLVKDFSPQLPRIMLDREQIKQVFLNLFLNSLQAMPEGGTLEVKTWLKRAPGDKTEDFICISVRDTGPGFPAEVKERVFDPFFTTKLDGIGLGLSLVYQIVEKHQGFIEVESQEGQGALFAINLPIIIELG